MRSSMVRPSAIISAVGLVGIKDASRSGLVAPVARFNPAAHLRSVRLPDWCRASALRSRNSDIAAEPIFPPVKGDGPAYLLNQGVHHSAAETLPGRRRNEGTVRLSPANCD